MNKNARTKLPLFLFGEMRALDVCSREIKREFFDKFPLKRKEGRFCCLERCEGKGLTFYTYILYIISKNFTTTQIFILGCDLRARRRVAERLSVFPIRQ